MKVEYRRDIQNSYLVLIVENQDANKLYDLRMITENRIEGLLSCERKLMNNDVLYYYDVTSKISLEDRCKVKMIQGQDILLLLNRLLGILDKLDEYLLSEKSLCLLPQYIYMGEMIEQISFCYVPGENWDFQVQLRELMEYLLPCLEHSSQESMMIGYGLYHYILRERFTVEGLHTKLNLYYEADKKKASVVESQKKEVVEPDLNVQKEEDIWQDIWEDDTEIQKENHSEKEYRYHFLGAFFCVFWVLGGWFLWRNFMSFLWIWIVIGIIVVLIFVIISLKWPVKKTENVFLEKNKSEYKIETEEVYTQVLNVIPSRKKYVLKDDKDIIPLNDKDVYVIGRDKKLADIVLSSNVVSRKHGQIRLGTNRCFLTDLYSKNGIRVNGVKIGEGEEIELFGGELIQFADIGYYFKEENEEPFLS